MGIVNSDDMQIVYSDTPGVLKPNYKLQESMLAFSQSALQDADVLLYVTDAIETPGKNQDFLDAVARQSAPVILVINKMDLTTQEQLERMVEEWHTRLPQAEMSPISALHKVNTDLLLRRIKELLPECPPYFDKDAMTDKPARFFVTEIIREKILQTYDKEIPYACEVRVEQFKEEETLIHINALIYVERQSQKGIIIGKGGTMLKRVGTAARKDIEAFFGKKVFLEIFVKVEKDWRNNQRDLDAFGYNPN
jgi:GTP-binding protein Era